MIIQHSHLNDMEILGTNRFIPEGFELGTTLSKPNRSIQSPSTALFNPIHKDEQREQSRLVQYP